MIAKNIQIRPRAKTSLRPWKFALAITSGFSTKKSHTQNMQSTFYSCLNREYYLSEECSNSLEGEITPKETYKAMITLANGKSAGPDSLPNEFYKWFAPHIVRTLTEVYNETFD